MSMPATTNPDSLNIEQSRERFVERIGMFFQTEGMPRTAGRMLGLLIFDGQPVSFSELADRLMVSRGSISTSSRLLEQAGLVKRVSKLGERQDFFQLADKPYQALVTTEIGRMQAVREDVAKALDQMPEGHEDTRNRLNDVCGFFQTMEGCLGGVLRKLSK